MFIGETGRTDLPDVTKTAQNAGLLYDSLHNKILPLGPQTLLYPGHGAGSVCGGKIASYDESTLGFEQTYNPAFTLSREDFIQRKLHERIPRPPYFSLMEEINLEGGSPLKENHQSIRMLKPQDFLENSKDAIIIDTRNPLAFAAGHIPNSYNIWLEGLPLFGGWIAKKETPLYLVVQSATEVETAWKYLSRIGMDNIAGVIAGNFSSWISEGLPLQMSGTISPSSLQQQRDKYQVLDVRDITEFEDEGHIPGAFHCYVGELGEYLQEHSLKGPLVVTCSVGHRASLAVSILLKKGYQNVFNLTGGMTAWEKLDFPIDKNKRESSFYYENKDSPPLAVDQQLH